MAKERQAVQDATMPQLQRAVDPKIMAPIVKDFLHKQYPDQDLQFRWFRVGRVFHRPGKDCRIVYRVLYKNGDANYRTLLLNGIATSRNNGYKKARKEMRDSWPGCGFWQPVSYLQEVDLKLYAFPYDPKMPYLGKLFERAEIEKIVRENLEAFSVPPEWHFRSVTPQIRKYRPFKRCLLRYQISFENNAGKRKHVFFFGKTYNSAESRYVFEALRRISADPVCSNGELNIPKPVAHIAEASTIWQLEWRGTNLSRVIEKQVGWEHLPESGYLEKIAKMLAALHRVEMPGGVLKPGPSMKTIRDNAALHARDILKFLPQETANLKHKLATFIELTHSEDNVPTATLHGTFKLAQILCRNNKLALLDFDSVASGDPHYDLAEFAASVLFLSVSDGISSEATQKSLKVFLDAYQQQVPWQCNHQRLAWYVVAFLLGKIHATLKRAEKQGVAIATDGLRMLEPWLERAK